MKYSIITSSYNQLEKLKRLAAALMAIPADKFQWIIADDGSSDGTVEYFNKNISDYPYEIKIVTQEDKGYRLVEILNEAAKVAGGEYLLWIMADTYPRFDFFEKFDPVVQPNRMVCAVRLNVNEEGFLISPDWRVSVFPQAMAESEVEIVHERPWEIMTLNGMCMSKKAWDEMGGISLEYKGYGRMDWDMAAWAFYHEYKLFWATRAFLNHDWHQDRVDTQENVDVFARRLEAYKKGEL